MAENLPLALKKDIRDNEDNLKANLQAIKDQVGIDFTVEVKPSMAAVNDLVDAGYKNRLGTIFYQALMGQVAAFIKKNAADSMVKEALVEATSAKKIIFEVDEAIKSYHQLGFAEGSLVVKFKPKGIWTNISDIGFFDATEIL